MGGVLLFRLPMLLVTVGIICWVMDFKLAWVVLSSDALVVSDVLLLNFVVFLGESSVVIPIESVLLVLLLPHFLFC